MRYCQPIFLRGLGQHLVLVTQHHWRAIFWWRKTNNLKQRYLETAASRLVCGPKFSFQALQNSFRVVNLPRILKPLPSRSEHHTSHWNEHGSADFFQHHIKLFLASFIPPKPYRLHLCPARLRPFSICMSKNTARALSHQVRLFTGLSCPEILGDHRADSHFPLCSDGLPLPGSVSSEQYTMFVNDLDMCTNYEGWFPVHVADYSNKCS